MGSGNADLPSGLLHPGALASVALLIVNDHWLKAAFPGVITGMLSDFAGLAFFPLLLQALWTLPTGRTSPRVLPVACVLTGLGFAAVKTAPLCNDAYEVGLGWLQFPFRALFGASAPVRTHLMMDPTDLVALPAVGLAWWWGRTPARDALDSRPP